MEESEKGEERWKFELIRGPSSSRENKGSVIWEFSSGASVDNNLAQPYIQQKYNAELSFAREYLLASKRFRRSNRFSSRCELRESMMNRVKKPVEKIFLIPVEKSPFINVYRISFNYARWLGILVIFHVQGWNKLWHIFLRFVAVYVGRVIYPKDYLRDRFS